MPTYPGLQHIILFSCLFIGWALSRRRVLPIDAATTLNRIIIYVALPALVFQHLQPLFGGRSVARDLPFEQLAVLAFVPWLNVFFATLVFGVLMRIGLIGRRACGALIMTTGFGNTSFVGFALIEATLGRDALGMAMIVDQLGSFLAVAILGTLLVGYFSQDTSKRTNAVDWRSVFYKVVRFPPFLALLGAISMSSVELPEMLFIGLGRIGQMVAPLALLSIGAQLNLERKAIAYHGRSLATGLAIKMVLFPILIAAIAWILGALPNMYGKVAVLESAMAPMMTSSILAIEADLEPELCALMVGIGVLVALFTVPLLHWVVEAQLV